MLKHETGICRVVGEGSFSMMPLSSTTENDRTDAEGLFRNLVDSLIFHLDREIALYREFRVVVYKERDVLRRPSPDVVQAINASKEACIRKARDLETARMRIITNIAALFNKKASEITISFLLPCLEKGQRDILRLRQEVLLSLAADVRKANENNWNVVDNSLASVKKSFHFINNLKAMHSGYLKSGKTGFGGVNGMLLCQEV
jgi:hypothetical protein